MPHYKPCQQAPKKQTAILIANSDPPRYSADSPYIQEITARPGLLSVTESVALPPQLKGGHMSDTLKFDLRDWLVPPVLLPIFLVLLVAAAMVIQW